MRGSGSLKSHQGYPLIMKKFIIASVLSGLLSSHAHAVTEPQWTWSFATDSLMLSQAWEPILIAITIKNDGASPSTLQLNGFDFWDGSFPNNGVLRDQDGRPVITLTQLAPTQSTLAPGESLTYDAFFGSRSSVSVVEDALSRGDTYTLNPLYHVRELSAQGASYSGRASTPFTIHFSAVPEPSIALLWLAGLPLLALAYMRSKRTASRGLA